EVATTEEAPPRALDRTGNESSHALPSPEKGSQRVDSRPASRDPVGVPRFEAPAAVRAISARPSNSLSEPLRRRLRLRSVRVSLLPAPLRQAGMKRKAHSSRANRARKGQRWQARHRCITSMRGLRPTSTQTVEGMKHSGFVPSFLVDGVARRRVDTERAELDAVAALRSMPPV